MDGDSHGARLQRDRATKAPEGGISGQPMSREANLGAGWRLLIYVAMFFMLWSISLFLLSQLLRPTREVFSPRFQLPGETASFLGAILAAWIMSQLEERHVGVYGLPARGAFGKLFWQGCLFGLCEIALLVGVIAAFGGYSFGGLAEHGGAIAEWALFWACFFVMVGLFEEFLFRGYTLYTLSGGIGFWPAAVLLSLAFAAFHVANKGEGWAGITSVAFVGLFWSFTLKRTGSLWFAVGMHATFDFGETFLFSAPDSGAILPGHLSNAVMHGPNWLTGGTAGPEGSIFDFLILAVFFLVVHFLYPAGEEKNGAEAS